MNGAKPLNRTAPDRHHGLRLVGAPLPAPLAPL